MYEETLMEDTDVQKVYDGDTMCKDTLMGDTDVWKSSDWDTNVRKGPMWTRVCVQGVSGDTDVQ